MPDLPGRARPIASTTAPIVDAVPIVLQVPMLRDIPNSASLKAAAVREPPRLWS
jgi:hypothetical protein